MFDCRLLFIRLAIFGFTIVIFAAGALAATGPQGPILPPPPPERKPPPSPAPVTECDRLVNKARHPDAVLPTEIGFLNIDAKAALPACQSANAAYPGVRRFYYLLARVYNRAHKFDLARKFYRIAARKGDAFAMISMAILSRRGQGGPIDLPAAARWIKRAAATGHPEALAILSNYYRFGLGVTFNPKRAFVLARQAAATGWPYALSRLAHLYKQGIGTERDAVAAAILYRRVFKLESARAQQGDPISMYRVAWAYLDGKGAPKDLKAGTAWLRKSQAAGMSSAIYSLGWLLKRGRGVKKDPKRACDLLERSARQLSPNALNAYAVCFATGSGRPKNTRRALQLFENAAARGNRYAPSNLAKRYRDGKVVKKNLAKAARLFRLAAERGHVASMVSYGIIRDFGRGVKADKKEACDWYERAAGLGHSWGMNNLAFCYETGKGRAKNVGKAFHLLEKAAANGNTLALRNLAIRYDTGRGVAADHERANRLFFEAATAGNSDAALRYGYNIFYGVGTPKDQKAGCDWFAKVAAKGNGMALNNLATCFIDGEGRTKDIKHGLALLEKAIAKNIALAMRNMAKFLLEGKIVKRNRARANKLYKRAAETGDVKAMYLYALKLFWGSDIKTSRARACRWFDKVARTTATFRDVNAYVGNCWEKGFGRRRNRKNAFKAFRTSAEAGSMIGMEELARAYDEGVGVHRNGEAAANWLRRSLAAGSVHLARKLISAPHLWHRSTRKALQIILKREGHYQGPTTGQFTAAMDKAIWDHAIGDSGGEVGERLTQEILHVPTTGAPEGLVVRVCRKPKSNRPQRLIVINHGLTTRRSDRRVLRADACGATAEFFAKRGFLVAFPVRRGYGETGGRFVEGALGNCRSWRYVKAGREMAHDIGAVVRALSQRPDVEPNGAVVMGHSGGGWGTVALAADDPDAVGGYINFSGGHGSRQGVPGTYCPRSLTIAISKFAKTSRKPVLWLYVKNDTYIGPWIARRMFRAFRKAGGIGEFVMMPPYQKEGHYLFRDSEVDTWAPVIDKWLVKNLKKISKAK